jgi:hypothetical protein
LDVQVYECDVAVIGGGFGGVAAALAAAEAGRSVVLTEPTDWIGGQVTAQAVSALDEHRCIESFGGTRSYYRFREGVRAVYQERYGGPGRMPDGLPLNPGNGWVSRLCFEPRVGLQVLEGMLAAAAAAGRLRVLLRHAPLAVETHNGRITRVTLGGPSGRQAVVHAEIYLDATELGDLLALARVPYVCGEEAVEDTGEPHASRDGPHPERVQSFTTCMILEYRPGEDHTIRKPFGYEAWRDQQPFTLTLRTREGRPRRYYMFVGDLPFWTYRRVLDARLFEAAGSDNAPRCDLALINWDANDYYKESLIDRSPAQQARILNEAKRLSLSFLYWLQTEAPRDGGGRRSGERGYPELRLAREALGTPDGLARAPYVREARRLLGLKRVLEQDVIEQEGRGARALHYRDSVGVGWYPIDLHRCAGDPPGGKEARPVFAPSLPFQIPLGALLSAAVDNLVAAAKNIAATHVTNGCYRLHPVEWNVGEAAGALAAYCLERGRSPRAVWEQPADLQGFQKRLLERGVPLFWSIDLGLEAPGFAAIQARLLHEPPPTGSSRRERLQILPDDQLTRGEAGWLLTGHPRAQECTGLQDLLACWREAAYAPFSIHDWWEALEALDLPAAHGSTYPTLRQVCENLPT